MPPCQLTLLQGSASIVRSIVRSVRSAQMKVPVMTRESPAGEGFTQVVDGLEREDPSVDAVDDPPHMGPVGWRGVPWLESGGATNPDLWADRLAWLEFGDDSDAEADLAQTDPEPAVAEPGPAIAELGPADAAIIGKELGLNAQLTTSQIHRIRRAFALHNHPDLHPPAQCELATQRMRIANGLIDAALQGSPKRHA